LNGVEADSIELKEKYLHQKAFLKAFGVTPLEGQIILDLCHIRDYYMDTRKLSRKLPPSLRVSPTELESILKKLIQSGFISPYTAKKDELCVRSSALGRDFSKQAEFEEGITSFEEIPALEKLFSQTKLTCYDPAGFKRGERWARGPNGERIKVIILEIGASDEVYETAVDGRTIYALKLTANAICPVCFNPIAVEYSYTPSTCYTAFNEFRCNQCNFRFMLQSALENYYI
jgi:hypothetical protein